MSWIPLKKIIEKIEARKFSRRILLLRYPTINIDTRDDYAILTGRWFSRSWLYARFTGTARSSQRWMSLEKVIRKISKRKFFWLTDPRTKYLRIKIDTRDNRCILMDRDGEIIARTDMQLNKFFNKLNRKANDFDKQMFKLQGNFVVKGEWDEN